MKTYRFFAAAVAVVMLLSVPVLGKTDVNASGSVKDDYSSSLANFDRANASAELAVEENESSVKEVLSIEDLLALGWEDGLGEFGKKELFDADNLEMLEVLDGGVVVFGASGLYLLDEKQFDELYEIIESGERKHSLFEQSVLNGSFVEDPVAGVLIRTITPKTTWFFMNQLFDCRSSAVNDLYVQNKGVVRNIDFRKEGVRMRTRFGLVSYHAPQE